MPIFITLKDFAEAPKQPDLLEYIDRVVPMPFDPSSTPPRVALQHENTPSSNSPR
ncbi:hypothetical protein H6F97_16590 [Microcoleus sp. FACHB-1]|nr:hypothetical protein [Microcoleus sp. FACHB-1]